MIARGGRLGGAAHGDTVATYAPFNPSRRPRRRRRDAFQTRVRVHVSPFNVSPPSKTRTIRKVRVLRPSSSSLPRDRGAPLELRHWRGGRGTGASGARKQRGVLRATFRTRRAYFFPWLEDPPIGQSSGWQVTGHSRVKSEDRGEQLVTAAVEIARGPCLVRTLSVRFLVGLARWVGDVWHRGTHECDGEQWWFLFSLRERGVNHCSVEGWMNRDCSWIVKRECFESSCS